MDRRSRSRQRSSPKAERSYVSPSNSAPNADWNRILCPKDTRPNRFQYVMTPKHGSSFKIAATLFAKGRTKLRLPLKLRPERGLEPHSMPQRYAPQPFPVRDDTEAWIVVQDRGNALRQRRSEERRGRK